MKGDPSLPIESNEIELNITNSQDQIQLQYFALLNFKWFYLKQQSFFYFLQEIFIHDSKVNLSSSPLAHPVFLNFLLKTWSLD